MTVDDLRHLQPPFQEAARLSNAERIHWIRYALKSGMTRDELHRHTSVDPWFLAQLEDLLATEGELREPFGLTERATVILSDF